MDYCSKFDVARGTLMEVGAGFGTFCEEINALRTFSRVVAVEPTPSLAATCGGKGLEVLAMPFEEVPDGFVVDVIVAFEVIEHLFSPREFFVQCTRLLRPGGLVIVSCPNYQGFDISTLGTLSNSIDHEHLNYFHTASLPLLAERCGFKVEEIETPGRLDAELVRRQVLEGNFDVSDQPFLREILVDRWDDLGAPFQSFLADNRLSSHMWLAATLDPGP